MNRSADAKPDENIACTLSREISHYRWVFLAHAVYHIYHQADQYEYLFSESAERTFCRIFQLVKQVIMQKPKLKAAKLIIATLMFDE